MKKYLIVFTLIFVCFFLVSCNNKKAELQVVNSYYYNSNGKTVEFGNKGKINYNDLLNKTVILQLSFNYQINSKNRNDLPKVKISSPSYSYVIKKDGKEYLTVGDVLYSESTDAVFMEKENDLYVISDGTSIKIPITDSGEYEIECYANYLINKKRIANSINFRFVVE